MDIKELLVVWRNIYYKCFFIGLFFLVAAAVIYLPCKCYVAHVYQTNFGISAAAYYTMWAAFIGIIKTILVFLFLVPALAIHWVGHVYKKTHME